MCVAVIVDEGLTQEQQEDLSAAITPLGIKVNVACRKTKLNKMHADQKIERGDVAIQFDAAEKEPIIGGSFI